MIQNYDSEIFRNMIQKVFSQIVSFTILPEIIEYFLKQKKKKKKVINSVNI